jgi:hypothetical protein
MSDSNSLTPSVELLQAEYLHLQGVVEDFDQRVITIKAWSVTLSMSGIGLAFSQKAPALFFLSGASAPVFWIIELIWKLFQHAFYPRLYEIEKHFRGDKPKISPFQISSSWQKHFNSAPILRGIKVAFYPHVMLPHVS